MAALRRRSRTLLTSSAGVYLTALLHLGDALGVERDEIGVLRLVAELYTSLALRRGLCLFAP